MSTHIKILFNSEKGNRSSYLEQNKCSITENLLCERFWQTTLNMSINDNKWPNIYKACFQTVSDNYIKWFQYKIFHQILGTKDYLCKINLTGTKSCRLCNDAPETVKHLFSECVKTYKLWSIISQLSGFKTR